MSRTLAEMEPVIQRIAAWEFHLSRDPLYDFSEFVQSSSGSHAAIESRLLRILQSGATLAGKDFVCRQLSVIGSEASVPVLSGMLLPPETSDMARYALQGIRGPASANALRAALPAASGKVKIGIVNSLGQCRDAKSVPALARLLASPDRGISEAAAGALAAVGDPAALDALDAARSRLNGGQRQTLSEAYLRCAEKVFAGGGKQPALRAFRQLAASGEPETVRFAALSGIVAIAGAGAVSELTKELNSTNSNAQLAAIRLLKGIPGHEITTLLVSRFAGLPPAAQVRVLAALGGRNDTPARPAVTQALNSADPAVRVAAAQALEQLGGGSSALALAGAAANAEGAEQAAVRASLYRVRGADVDAAVVTGIGSSPGASRLELIRAAGERGLSAAGDALIVAARGPDRQVRRESVRALRYVAGPAHSPALLELLVDAEDDSGRREYARALASSLKRTTPPRLSAVIGAYQSAASVPVRAALLEVMGQVSSSEALPVLRRSLNDGQPEVVRSAILALSEWLTPEPMPDLVAVARSSSNQAHQILALRGYIKLIAAPSDRSIPQTVSMLAEAMSLARQPEEKRAILSMLSNFATKEALELATSAARDSAVEREANAAAGRIRLSLGALR